MKITSCGHELEIPDAHAEDFASEVTIRDQFWRIAPGDVVLDIGASVGTYALPALALGASVFAVDVLDDPHTSPLACIAHDNGLTEKLVIIQCAVGDADGYPSEIMSVVHSEQPDHYGGIRYPGLKDCNWSTVDKLVSGYCIEQVDWIKIDTEGGELPILRGAGRTLDRDHPKLLVEEHSHLEHIRNMGSAAQLRELLSYHGYIWVEVPYEDRALWFCSYG